MEGDVGSGDVVKMPHSSPEKEEDNSGNNLYIANLSYKTSEEDLRGLLAPYGVIKECNVVLDPLTKESRGFAFLKFETVQEAEKAIEEANGRELNGRKLRIEKARRSRPHGPTPGRYMGKSKRDSRDRYERRRSRSGSYRRRSRSSSSPRHRRSRSRSGGHRSSRSGRYRD